MVPNFLFSSSPLIDQYILELVEEHSHHIWLATLKSKEPNNNFVERFLHNLKFDSHMGASTLQIQILSEFVTDKVIMKRFVMVKKTSRSRQLDAIDPLVKWSFQCGFFSSFSNNLKSFRLSKLGALGFVVKAWDLHLCTLSHSTIWDRANSFMTDENRTIAGQTLSLNPNFVLDAD